MVCTRVLESGSEKRTITTLVSPSATIGLGLDKHVRKKGGESERREKIKRVEK